MAPSESPLFQPITFGALTLPGRVFKAATSETRASEDGFVTDELLAFYEPVARAGTPLLITGNLHVSLQGKSTARQCGAEAEDKVPGLRQLADLAHRHGTAIFAQLNHCGRQVVPGAVGNRGAVSASGVKELFLGTKPRPLAREEIREVVESFAAAAERCRRAGFDGIQIHAAHGYLLNQFLTPYTNRRDDEYGGSPANRLRLLVEVHRAIRERVGAGYPVILKLNGADNLFLRRGLSTTELVEVARAMEGEGIDGVEISVGHYESGLGVVRGKFLRFFRAMARGRSTEHLPALRRLGLRAFWPVAGVGASLLWPRYPGFNLRYARRFKQALRIPVVCVGGFATREEMERALAEGGCDAVSCARTMIADPYLYKHLKEGRPGPRCVFCNACVGRVGDEPADCYHPRVRRERDTMLAREGG